MCVLHHATSPTKFGVLFVNIISFFVNIYRSTLWLRQQWRFCALKNTDRVDAAILVHCWFLEEKQNSVLLFSTLYNCPVSISQFPLEKTAFIVRAVSGLIGMVAVIHIKIEGDIEVFFISRKLTD